jgi:hypothetical protein
MPCGKWRDRNIPEEYDLSLLLPPTLEKGKRFETPADAAEITAKYTMPALRRSAPRIAEAIEDCLNDGAPCGQPVCAVCARAYRRYSGAETLRLYEGHTGSAATCTIFLEKIPAGRLSEVDLVPTHDALRKRFQRAGFLNMPIAGGTEVGYRASADDWILHAHLLVLGASQIEWINLERASAKGDVHDALRIAPVTDPIEQISYLQKFHTYHRPGKTRGKRRARAYPLKKNQLCELACWAARYNFDNFTFCAGVRRRHGRLCLS